MTITELLREGTAKLRQAGVTEAELDSLLLLGHCLKLNRTELFLHGHEMVDDQSLQLYTALVQRRATREPLAYIIGSREFWSLEFLVNSDVLIPRPETEFLVETALGHIHESSLAVGQVADICCGSGIIAVVLARELRSRITAIDCSPEALAVCQKNCRRHRVDEMVRLVCGDLFQPIHDQMLFSCIVANPPYIQSSDIDQELEPEVAEHEPRLALDGGGDGLGCIRRLASQVIHHLEPGGFFFMEFGAGQAEAIHQLFSAIKKGKSFFQKINILQDYSGKDRVLVAQLNQYSR